MIYQIGGNTPSVVREYLERMCCRFREEGWLNLYNTNQQCSAFSPQNVWNMQLSCGFETKVARWDSLPVSAFSWKISSWKISGSRVEALAQERRRTSIMFAGHGSIGVNLYAPTWNTTLRFTAVPWTTSCLRRSECKGESLFRRSAVTLTPVPAHSQVLFSLYFGTSCSMVPWLIVILINGSGWTPVPILDL